MQPVRIAQFGLGPIGIEAIRLTATKRWARIVGAVDSDPSKVGKSLGELAGIDELRHAKVFATFEELHRENQAQVILHAACSKLSEALEQIVPMADRGIAVASTCEELLFPQWRDPEGSAKLDSICRRSGARVVGTGVNPGFVMDLLPILLTGMCRRVDRVFGERVVNASTRRKQLQQKIGSGMLPDDFRKLFAQGKIGHAGFQESTALVAHALGWKLDAIRETCEPIIADHDIQTQYFRVPKGCTCGVHQRSLGVIGGENKIELDLKMYLDAPEPHDAVRIDGDPPLDVLVRGGVAGDTATVAALVNVVPRLLAASPGLRRMTELPATLSDG